MPKKSKHVREPGTFLRFDTSTREWLSAKARADARSVAAMVRKIVADAKAADSRTVEDSAPVREEVARTARQLQEAT